MTPEGEPATGSPDELLIPDDPEERLLCALRLVAQRCLYGVDINPLAVEMAKLSLWLLTMAKDKPFEFLDHNIRCGDSLVGLHNLDQLKYFSLKPESDDTAKFFGPLLEGVDEAINLRLKLEDLPANTVEDVQRQEQFLAEANEKIARLRCAADMLVAAEFWGGSARDKLERVRHAAVVTSHYVEKGPTEEFELAAAKERRGQKMFHWPLEFPEVIVKRGGFDAFVGNPPFMGGRKIYSVFGDQYRNCLASIIADRKKGSADLCVYFLLRVAHTLSSGGVLGLVTTSAVAEADSREVGLERITNAGYSILRGSSRQSWLGSASVTYTLLWIRNGGWSGGFVLNDRSVSAISPFLTEMETIKGAPDRLIGNMGTTFNGTKIHGTGFILTPDEARRLIETNSRNREVLSLYLTGKELNAHPQHAPSSWVINFHDWTFEEAQEYPECLRIVTLKVKPYRDGLSTKQIHESDYWKFWDKRLSKYAALREKQWGMAIATQATKYVAFARVDSDKIFSHALSVVISDSFELFAILNSSLHDVWARTYASYNLQLLRYATSDLFDTYPFPVGVLDGEPRKGSRRLNQVGEEYDQLRAGIMLDRQEGLTDTYNRFHDPNDTSTDIQKLRQLHVEMDRWIKPLPLLTVGPISSSATASMKPSKASASQSAKLPAVKSCNAC